jgi:hypothetical protein
MYQDETQIMLLIDELLQLLDINEDSERVNYLVRELFEFISMETEALEE